MTNHLTEYKLDIKNDEDLERWKSTWDGKSDLPKEVERYMRAVVLPRIDTRLSDILAEITKK